MLNCFTNGTKYDASYYKPFNEDYIVIGKIKAFDGHQIVFCKVWDTTEKLYYAKPIFNANNTEIETLEDYFDIGEYSVFYRVGDFNSKGSISFERHIEDTNNTSWIVFTVKKKVEPLDGDLDLLIDEFGGSDSYGISYNQRSSNGWTYYYARYANINPASNFESGINAYGRYCYGSNCSSLYVQYDSDIRQKWQIKEWNNTGINPMASYSNFTPSTYRMNHYATIYKNNIKPYNNLTDEFRAYYFNRIGHIQENDGSFSRQEIAVNGILIPLPSCYEANNSYLYDGKDTYTTPNNQLTGVQEPYNNLGYIQVRTELELETGGYVSWFTGSELVIQDSNVSGNCEGCIYVDSKNALALAVNETGERSYHTITNATRKKYPGSSDIEYTINFTPPITTYKNYITFIYKERKSLLGSDEHTAYGKIRYEHYKLSINDTYIVETLSSTKYCLLGCNFNKTAINKVLIGSQLATKKEQVPNYPGVLAGAVYGTFNPDGSFNNPSSLLLKIKNEVIPYVEFSLEAKYWSVVDQITGLWRQAVPGDTITGITYGDKWITYRCGIEDYTNYTYNLAIKENYKNNIWWQGITKTLL
jgi:hypothetical protein